MLVLLFALPFVVKSFYGNTIIPEILQNHVHETPKQDLFVLEEVCISQVQSTGEEICNCTTLDYNNVFLYEDNKWYDSFFYGASWVSPFLYLIGGLMLFLFLSNVLYLKYLTLKYPKKKILVNNESYWLLSIQEQIAAGSFRLIDKYIIINEERLKTLSEQEQNAVLFHEVEHIKQLNTWELISLSVVQLVWFVNPIFYYIKNELIELSEFMADAAVVQNSIMDNKSYAMTLVRLKSSQQTQLITQFKSNNKATFKARIKTLLEQKNQNNSIKYFSVGLLLVAFFIAVQSLLLFQPIEKEVNNIVLYQFVQKEHQEKGKNAFCKTCISKEYLCE